MHACTQVHKCLVCHTLQPLLACWSGATALGGGRFICIYFIYSLFYLLSLPQINPSAVWMLLHYSTADVVVVVVVLSCN
jgi:hypothetical protein